MRRLKSLSWEKLGFGLPHPSWWLGRHGLTSMNGWIVSRKWHKGNWFEGSAWQGQLGLLLDGVCYGMEKLLCSLYVMGTNTKLFMFMRWGLCEVVSGDEGGRKWLEVAVKERIAEG